MCALNVCEMLGVASGVTFHLNPIGFSVFHVVHLGLIKSKNRVSVNSFFQLFLCAVKLSTVGHHVAEAIGFVEGDLYHAQDDGAVNHVHGLVGDCFGFGLVVGLYFVLAETPVAVFGLDSECVFRVVHLEKIKPKKRQKVKPQTKKKLPLVNRAL